MFRVEYPFTKQLLKQKVDCFFVTFCLQPTEVSETTLQHIFREAPGHVNPATIQSQTRFLNLFSRVASNPNNLVQTANEAARAAGVQTFKQVFKNGEVWVQIFKGQIRNAGVNILP